MGFRSGIYLKGWQAAFDENLRAWEEELRRPLVDHRGRAVPRIGGGAFGSSGLYLVNMIDIFDATQLAIDLSLTSHKWAMYTNTLTPNFSSDQSYSATNEVSGTGYTAGGKDLTGLSPGISESPTGTAMYDMGDISWASSSIANARGAILYADALAGNNLIVAMTFGADFTSSNGTFLITFASGGVFTIDFTP